MSISDKIQQNEKIQTQNAICDDVDRVYTVSGLYAPGSRLIIEIPFRECEIDGVLRVFSEKGKLLKETPYQKGIREGVAKEYDEDGNLIKEILYQNSEAIKVKIISKHENKKTKLINNMANSKLLNR